MGKNGPPELRGARVRVSRLDTNTEESEQRPNDANSWDWGEGGTKSGQLTLPEQWRDEMERGHELRPAASAAFGPVLFRQT